MEFTILHSLIIAAIGIAGVFIWVYITKDDSDENIKMLINNYYSIIFYGIIIVALSLTFYNYFS